ncbi:MAG: diguanylate cyclase domain-containing protein [Terriglobia bacterium]
MKQELERAATVLESASLNRPHSAVEALRIRQAGSVDSPFVTVTAGVASVLPTSGSDPRELLRQADAAMYEAKQKGRNRGVTPTTVAG